MIIIFNYVLDSDLLRDLKFIPLVLERVLEFQSDIILMEIFWCEIFIIRFINYITQGL